MRFILFLFTAFTLYASTITLHNGQTFVHHYDKYYATDCKTYTTMNHLLVIPLSYYTKRSRCKIAIDGKKFILNITPKNYPKERLHVAKSKVSPPQSVLKRIRKEFAEAKRIYSTVTPKSYVQNSFVLPINAAITDPFGVARLFNGKLKSYHSGTDFRAAMGTPIKAINDGKVVLAKKRYYAGGSIILDHGKGIYSCYYHLSKFLVKPGEFVKRGQIIGLSGKSGRVTGPHLHLTIKIKGITVDPLQFIDAYNNTLKTVSYPQ
ncbi:M23 family metallopeptidase [Nitratiruptor sp. YY09-18]|uniref:M23 family metallopeptidase n=1 Tax=Nitratiruptor sp. YY09-18 TaxID=2724901 RepID=UPI00191619F1|nr:M23 family metallopeptidase [Nitratiruptor sp. YY09-18]BCD67323.1 Cell wall endopeptidase, family M23/M37 [Nitratiruptor sp. YY09-18]